MIIKPKVKANIALNSHPIGIKHSVRSQIERSKELGSIECPKNVLIIGGSSGYGLASRISLAFSGNCNTLNVSYESKPKGKSTGSAGWWNNIYFQEYAKETNNYHKDIIGDAFSFETKQLTIDEIKKNIGKIDLVVYSIASGVRVNPYTNERVQSSLKTIDKPITAETVDIASETVKEITVDVANQEDINNTVYVMGGEDWKLWIDELHKANVLAENVKTIAYTYIGGKTTEALYRKGTIGKAKEDLEASCVSLNEYLMDKYNGQALISSSKALTTKASVFIPAMPKYIACLYEIMLKSGTHENTIEQKHRLFKDVVYGDVDLYDDKKRIRMDNLEMDEKTQEKTIKLMNDLCLEDVLKLEGGKLFINEFHQLNGFRYEEVDYSQDVDMESLVKLELE